MSHIDLGEMPTSGNLMDLLKHRHWQQTAAAAEALVEGSQLAGVDRIGWMATWPQLQTYAQYEQLRSLVLRGFAAVIENCNLGAGYSAALDCGKPLVMERLRQATPAIQAQLLGLVQGEPLGPKVALTTERLIVLRALFQDALSSEDWDAIALAAAAQIHCQVIEQMVVSSTASQ